MFLFLDLLIIRIREKMKVIIASATLDAEKFSLYFDNAPIIYIPGRRYPVDIYYTKAPEADYVEAAVVTALQIHCTQDKGDILVFLTGQEEIERAEEMLLNRTRKLGTNIGQLMVLPLYSQLPSDQQAEIFNKTPKFSRKVVLCTNIAETSLTIDNIVFVIDCGFSKQTAYNPKTGIEALVVTPISKANSDQRAGRAGRVCPGKCFRLYTLWSFQNELEDVLVPEIQRSNLNSIVLQLKCIGIDNLIEFDYMDAPNYEMLLKALQQLYMLNALNKEGTLTNTGKKMSEFPLEPCLAKCIIESEKYKCVDQMISIASLISSGGNLFYRPKDKLIHADAARMAFQRPGGDHMSLLNVYNQWVETNYSDVFCREHYIQPKMMKKVRDIREQISGISYTVEIGIPFVYFIE